MSRTAEAFNRLDVGQRLSLLVSLGVDDPMRYREWKDANLRYEPMFHEVQEELD